MPRNPRPIYGSSARSSANCACDAAVSPAVGITTVLSIVSTLQYLVREFFNPTAVKFPFSATMSFSAYIPAAVGVRLLWKTQNPGVMFDRTDNIHRLQIKALYLALNREADWEKDVLYSLSGELG